MDKNILYGDYVFLEDFKETSRLFIRMPTEEIVHFWSRCGLIANFSSSYIALGCKTERNITNSLSFILNELLENSVKYSYAENELIEVNLLQKSGKIIMEVSNFITKDQFEKMSVEADEIINIKDISAKYIEKITSNAKNMNKSGLGLLSLINYYNVKISFRFIETDEIKHIYKLSVQIQANIEEL